MKNSLDPDRLFSKNGIKIEQGKCSVNFLGEFFNKNNTKHLIWQRTLEH